ncbi:MAG: CDP-alcohol phosphatidyltransferase family protein [Bacilli bacterium]|nr:CDP-alcohol phosphatidyltransferase family protein [Bacilli bacterium]
MKKFLRSNAANFITSLRIIGAIVLIFFPLISWPFFIIYSLCGITDVLDGFVARKLHISSLLGSILDSLSDLLFYTVLAVKVFPVAIRLLPIGCWIVILSTTAVHIIGYIICYIKYRRLSALHTYANKLMSLLIFFFPFSLIGEIKLLYSLYVYIGGIFAMYSAIEVCLIHLISKRYDERNKSVFFIKRNEKEDLVL